LIAHIKKLKYENKSQQEAQEKFNKKEENFEKEFNKNLSKKDEDKFHLKNLNRELIEQIKKLKDENLEKSSEREVERVTHTHSCELLSTNKSAETQKVEVSTTIPQAA